MEKYYILGFGIHSQNLSSREYFEIVHDFLKNQNLYDFKRKKLKKNFLGFATIDRLKYCPKIQEFINFFDKPCFYFTKTELLSYKDSISISSDFVMQKIGIPSVAEAAALAAHKKRGKIYLSKTKYPPFTFALTYRETKK